MEFKELYSFTVDEEVEVEKKTTKKDKKTGEETTITKKVKEKVPVVVKIKRPSRRELEEAELEYSVEMSRCVKKGILTKAMLAKKYHPIINTANHFTPDKVNWIRKRILDHGNESIRKLDAELDNYTVSFIFK